jgi:Reverse transcriptase (RNA-dependent DNA polymerase)
VRAIDNSQVSAFVLLDLSSAFDTVDHAVLLSALSKRFSVCDKALNWFHSYISLIAPNTFTLPVIRQPVFHAAECSVPQGSVLGPLEFIVYTEEVGSIIGNRAWT